MHIFFSGVIYAQNEFGSESDVAKEAKELFDKAEYVKALPLYSQLLSLHPKDPFYNYSFGVCVLFGDKRDTEKPIRYLEFAEKNLEGHPEVHYYLGMVYHINYRFAEAIKEYQNFIDKASASNQRKFDATHNIEMCENGISLLNTINDLYILEKTEVHKKNFYRSYDIDEFSGKFLFKPYEIKSRVDIKKDDQSIIFFSDTNKVIYFSSYGENKKGSKDIYRSVKLTDGTWSVQEKLDTVINTAYDEDYPYLLPDGRTLYFSSKGHNSMGGYDIFKSVFDTASGKWSKPENLDFAINTPFDDILFVSDSTQKYACFSSVRNSVDDYITVYKVRIDKRPVIRENLALDRMIEEGEADKDEEYQATLSYIKDKARLDVNATDEIADNTLKTIDTKVEESQAKEEIKDSGLEDKLAEKVKQRTLNEKMVDTAFAIVENGRKELQNIKQKKLAAFYVANQKQLLSAIRYRQSEQLFAEAEKITEAQSRKQKHDLANEVRKESSDLESESRIANNIGKQLEKQQAYKEKELERIRNYAGDIQKLVAVENTDSSSVLLENLLAEVRNADTLIDYSTPVTYIKGINEHLINEAVTYFDNAESLESEAKELEQKALGYIEEGDKEADENRRSNLLQRARQLADQAEQKRKESITEEEKGKSIAFEAGDVKMEAASVYSVMNEVDDLRNMDEQQLAIANKSEELHSEIRPDIQTKADEIERRYKQYQADETVQKQDNKEVAESIIAEIDKLVSKVEEEENFLRQNSETLLVYADRQHDLALKKMAEADSLQMVLAEPDIPPDKKNRDIETIKTLREESLQHSREAVAGFKLSEQYRQKTEEKLYETALQRSRAEDIHALLDDGEIAEARQELDRFKAETNEIISDTSYHQKINKENRISLADKKAEQKSLISEADILKNNAAGLEQKAVKLRSEAEMKKSLEKMQKLLTKAEEYETESREIKSQATEKYIAAEKLRAEISMIEMQQNISDRIVPQIVADEGVDSTALLDVDVEELSGFVSDNIDNEVFADSNVYTSATAAIVKQYEGEVTGMEQIPSTATDETQTASANISEMSIDEAEKELSKAYLISRSVDLINSEITIMKRDILNITDERQKAELNEQINKMQHLSDSLSVKAYEGYKMSENILQREGKDMRALAGQYDDQSLALSLQEEAYDNFSAVNTLRNRALITNDKEERQNIINRAYELEEIAMYKQLEVFEVFGIGNRNNYYANKIILNRIRIDSQNDEKLRVARQLEEEAQYLYEQALYYRYKSKQEDLPYDQKLVFLQEANSLELQALEKQKEAMDIYRDANRRAPSDREILAERLVPLNILESDEQQIADIRDRMAGISRIKPELAVEEKPPTEIVQETRIQEQLSPAVKDTTGEVIAEYSPDISETQSQREEELVSEPEEPNKDLVNVIVDKPEAYITYYSDEYPIPVNPDLPVGLIFKVQIAAFRNPIPQNTFAGLSPVSAEKVATSSFTRYMAGLFYDLDEATTSRDKLRRIGYADAFVVAYLNGQRINLAQARDMIRSGEAVTTTAIASELQLSDKLQTEATATATVPTSLPPEEISGANEYFSVQIGVYSRPLNVSQLLNLEPIYYDKLRNTYWRYISGVYATRVEANLARDLIRNRGITDAFVIRYDDEKRKTFARLTAGREEVAERQDRGVAVAEAVPGTQSEQQVVNNNFSGIRPEDVRFMVQIAAFREDMPLGMIDMFFKSLNIIITKHSNDKGMTVYTAGSYSDYTSAEDYKNVIIEKGIKDAFVVAYAGDRRIPVQQALEMLNP